MIERIISDCDFYEIIVFFAIAKSHNGQNNGWLESPRLHDLAGRCGKTKLKESLKTLEQKGFIVKTRQGRRGGGGITNLWALAHLPIVNKKEPHHENPNADRSKSESRPRLRAV